MWLTGEYPSQKHRLAGAGWTWLVPAGFQTYRIRTETVNRTLAIIGDAPKTSLPGRAGKLVMGLREHKKRQVWETVLSVSVKLFESQGFANTSMDQIAAASMISRTTLFNYFPSKDSIVLELAKPFEDTYPDVLHDLCARPGTTAQRIERAFSAAADHFIKYRAVNSVIYLELTRIRSTDTQANNAAIKKYRDAIISLLRLGVEQGDVRTDIDPGIMADLILAPLLMGLYRMFGGTEDFDIKANFNRYAQLLTDAVVIRQAPETPSL